MTGHAHGGGGGGGRRTVTECMAEAVAYPLRGLHTEVSGI